MFCVPLALIALYEASLGEQQNTWMTKWLSSDNQGDEDYPETRDPEVNEPDGLKITKVPFEELIKVFPNTQQVRLIRNLVNHILTPPSSQALHTWPRRSTT